MVRTGKVNRAAVAQGRDTLEQISGEGVASPVERTRSDCQTRHAQRFSAPAPGTGAPAMNPDLDPYPSRHSSPIA
jgi:hypothetical protein